eukprot:COSAG04_NODE_7813_length_1063_cov_1.233402_2_plen_167_part_00
MPPPERARTNAAPARQSFVKGAAPSSGARLLDERAEGAGEEDNAGHPEGGRLAAAPAGAAPCPASDARVSPLGPDLIHGAAAQELREVFDAFDTDGSGDIDANELEAAMKALGFTDTTEAHVQEMMSGVDKDSDGSIDFDGAPIAVRRSASAFLSPADSGRRAQSS